MESTQFEGVYSEHDKLYTKNLRSSLGIPVYNEKIVTIDGTEFRSWTPYRSKLAASLKKGLADFSLTPTSIVLYLGAATGTTVSHISDIVTQGVIYAVERSPVAMHSLLQITKQRPNIIPLLADANHPEAYSHYINSVDFLYQDISQRNQAQIFLVNMKRYLKKEGTGLLMVKARSIDVSLRPRKVYEQVAQELQAHGVIVHSIIELAPYEKDHAAISISY
jgi:fibrillarin-like pre-rRNA processing protein